MPSRRHVSIAPPGAASSPFPLATGLRAALREGYHAVDLRADLLAGLVVGIVALPLSMALAVATGVAPQNGLYTAIVAGFVVSLLGGSRFQVTGPTAAFIVILAPIVSQYGLSGLLTAGFLAGLMLLIMGAAKLGRLIEFIPHPVTTGFTAGIATVIGTLQLKDAFGLQTGPLPDHFVERVQAMWSARDSASLPELGIAASTLLLLLVVPRLTKRVPAPLVAIVLVSGAVFALHTYLLPNLHVATIGTRFSTVVDGVVVPGIPRLPPTPMLPWGEGLPSFDLLNKLLMPAFAIAMLGAIESLLSAVVADGMTGRRHDPNAELLALGVGNIIAPFFGGIAATGALARTATNVRAGARSPIAAAFHAIVVLSAVLLFAPLVAFVPMSSLAGLLLLIAYNMSEVRHFVHTVRVAPKSDVILLLTCYFVTVVFDMVFAVSLGVVLAALLFMRRMATLTRSELVGDDVEHGPAPRGVAVYRIAGPLFFGAAQKAMGALDAIADGVRVVILDFSRVPTIDATGLVALESALARLSRLQKFVVLAGPLPEPHRMFEKANLDEHHANCLIADDLDMALLIAQDLVILNPQWESSGTPLPHSVRS
jgi:SulP family sulfate permease